MEEAVAMNVISSQTKEKMAASMNISASYLIPAGALPLNNRSQHRSFINPHWNYKYRPLRSRASLQVRAAKLPAGVSPSLRLYFSLFWLSLTSDVSVYI